MPNGIRIAQEGYRTTDSDNRQAYSSDWPILTVVEHGQRIGVTDQAVVTDHNLGFNPMFLIFTTYVNNEDDDGLALTDSYNDDFGVTETELRRVQASNQAALDIYYYIFNVNLDELYEAPDLNLGTEADAKARINLTTGVKIAGEGKTLQSNDFKDLNIRSDAASPMVHKVVPGTKTADSTIVSHNLGYAPNVFAYVKSSTHPDHYVMLLSSLNSSITADTKNADVSAVGFGGAKETIVILKDQLKFQ